MDHLIPLVNKLQDALVMVEMDDPIDLPQIIVVGSQSSGKSSVLESLVGRDFLPRGSGIVTRRPLLLQLISTKQGPGGHHDPEMPSEYGIFSHTKDKIFTDFNEIRAEIEAETDRVAGKGKSVSDKPINLRIYSPRVLNLTLIDLPGLTKVAVNDQPKDIEAQIRRMVHKFIKNPNSIILAVSAANVDLANSDALNMARDVDPTGDRTVGVLTKLDLMDQGTHALDALLGNVYRLKLGFIGVVNRSQHSINTNRSIEAALEDEKQFFEAHKEYASVKARSGYPYLAKTLNQVLLNKIRETLPSLKVNLANKLRISQEALAQLGDPQMNQSKPALLLNILTRYAATFSATIDGQLPDLPLTELYGGSRINSIFVDVYGKYLEQVSATDGLTEETLSLKIAQAKGLSTALFGMEKAFDSIVTEQLRLLRSPSLDCAEFVFEELKAIAAKIDIPELKRFAVLKDKIADTVNTLLSACHTPTRDMIEKLIEIECGYINTAHPEFINDSLAMTEAADDRAKHDASLVPSSQLSQSAAPGPSAGASSSSSSSNSGRPGQPMATKPTIVPSDIPHNAQDRYMKTRDDILSDRSRREEMQRKEEETATKAAEAGFFTRMFTKRAAPAASPPVSPPRYSQPPASITPENLGAIAATNFQTRFLAILLNSYFEIVKKNIRDRVPKVIMHFLVTKAKESLQTELVRQLYKEEMLEVLLRESGDVAFKRQRYAHSVELFKKAIGIIGDVETNRM